MTVTLIFSVMIALVTANEQAARQESVDGTTSEQIKVEEVCVADPDAPRKFPPEKFTDSNRPSEARQRDIGLAALDKAKLPERRQYVYISCPPINK
jgi:hypothetical protein